MACGNSEHENHAETVHSRWRHALPSFADLMSRFELFLLGEGEKKIEEKVYSGRIHPQTVAIFCPALACPEADNP
ncbi:hypothetical protein GMORB2_2933 [Geosmithia morbida]|uniref:Uncharacterized protein n=1 Tax=Geosmithia morbida TaxID=1094350 RepID=A0A9P4YPS5_9HYPO|nr:uncharacterized protein GMORB2_2933 [Geosmithia morbida]KAF4120495.1 hypothetical protein GMORB2_2933 [Geosmithia morbida]